MNKLISILIIYIMCFLIRIGCQTIYAADDNAGISIPAKTLVIIGDSTVCNWPEKDVRRGWGQFIREYFSDSIVVINKARSGRSTKTFIHEGLWREVLELKPDYMLIQFGHNDSHAPENPESTNAQTDYQDYLRQYIDESRQIGSVPILVTPVYRRKFDGAGRIKDNLLPYADAMKQVAEEKNVPLVDLNSASEKLYLELGPNGVMDLANAPDDQTHFNQKGAKIIAALVMEQLPQVESSLKVYLKNKDGGSNQKMMPAEIEPIQAPFAMPKMERPAFQDKDFNIADFGAKDGGAVKNTEAITRAIEACHEAGGGRVVVPKGKWLTGAVHLKSNVNLCVAEGGELIFSDDPDDYLPAVHTTWEGLECYNYSPLIYAYECENIAITGKGSLICIQDKWREWMDRPSAHMQGLKELYEMAAKNILVRERNMVRDNINLRPQFIQPNRCKNVLIENVTIRNSPFWTVHPVLCENVIIRGIDVRCRGRNTDGVDPEFCRNVLIEYCRFDQGDDPIVIKAGRNRDAWRIGKCSENIVIRYCTVILGHNLLAIGSEMSGGVRNVYMHDCRYQPYEGFVRSFVLIKTNHRRGGFVENICVDNIQCNGTREVKALLEIDTDVLYQWRDLVPTYERRLTKIRNIQLKNIVADKARYGLWIHGEAEEPVRDILLENITVNEIAEKAREIQHAENIQERNVQFGTAEKSADGQPKKNTRWKFDFGTERTAGGYTPVTIETLYTPESGYGFLPGADISAGTRDLGDAVKSDFCTSDKPFLFSEDVPEEGNYRITLTLGGSEQAETVVKAESRRLMLESIKTAAGTTQTCSIIVNVRNSRLPDGRSVKLKSREIGVLHWDNSLTLEFNGKHPSVCAVEIEKADNVPTVFLAGDSTVTDQTREPWTSWGQMLTRFFKPEIAVANYAESGETLKAFMGERRLEKLLAQMKAGDYLFIQFAHNDMKRGTPEEIGYQDTLRHFIDETRKRDAHPVFVTSMHRRRFDENGKVVDTMQGFPEAMKVVAEEQNVPLIDLHAMSRKFYEALGPEESARAFVDGTHHNAYGAYELAKCIIEGIKAHVPELAEYMVDDMLPFDPAKPDPVDEFDMPASPMQSDVKPEGS